MQTGIGGDSSRRWPVCGCAAEAATVQQGPCVGEGSAHRLPLVAVLLLPQRPLCWRSAARSCRLMMWWQLWSSCGRQGAHGRRTCLWLLSCMHPRGAGCAVLCCAVLDASLCSVAQPARPCAPASLQRSRACAARPPAARPRRRDGCAGAALGSRGSVAAGGQHMQRVADGHLPCPRPAVTSCLPALRPSVRLFACLLTLL